jgi:hypothetical protein
MDLHIVSAPTVVPAVGSNPTAMARGLVAFWYERWGACERLSDLPMETRALEPWTDHLAVFGLVDHGADFQVRSLGEKLIPLLGRNWSGSMLSKLPSPLRQDLRQVLLRASMIREPAAEHYDWLIDGRLWSSTACAMPIAGELFQPTQLLLGLFYKASGLWLQDRNTRTRVGEWARTDTAERSRRVLCASRRL